MPTQRALQQCLVQLRIKLRHGAAMRDRHERRQNLVKYISSVTTSVVSVLTALDDTNVPTLSAKRSRAGSTSVELSARAAEELPPNELVKRIRAKNITAATLRTRLETHVEQANYASTFESVAAAGPKANDRSPFYIPYAMQWCK